MRPLAGVSSAGNVSFIVLALTQTLGVGTVALVSHAAGRKDQLEANLIFNQSVLLSGIVQPTMIVQVLTVVLNTVFAPILIAGWGTHHPLGVAGAGLASTVSIAIGVVFLWLYFAKLEKYVSLHPSQWVPRLQTCKRILNIGLPAGGEFLMMFVFVAVIYWAIRDFGPAAQAGFGIASRVMQAIFLPVMALAFAASPLAGQNFGAGKLARVKETFWTAALMSSAMMLAVTLLCQWRPELLIRAFSSDPQVIAVGGPYLQIISWNFVATGLIFTCSSLFQALGNTWPSLLSSASRLITFALPAAWMSAQPHFELRHLWYLSVCTVSLQAVLSLTLFHRQFHQSVARRQAAVVN